MSWVAIAKKDFRDAVRAKILWGSTAIFCFLYAIFLLVASDSGDQPAVDALGGLLFTGGFLLPLVVISMGYLAVAGERDSGSIKYLLGLPNSRREVLFGKLVGRGAVAVLAISIAILAGAGILIGRFGTVPVEYGIFAALTLLFTMAFISIAVGFSALVDTRGKAMGATIGAYFLVSIVWVVPGVNPQDSVSFVVEDVLGMGATPELYQFVQQLSPVWAYVVSVNSFIYPDSSGGTGQFDPGAADTPLYLTDEFLVVVLVLWIVLPMAIGYARFRSAELG